MLENMFVSEGGGSSRGSDKVDFHWLVGLL